MVRLLAERSNTKSNVMLGGFQSQLQASYVSSHTEELWYNKTVCLWMTIYIYIYIYVYGYLIYWDIMKTKFLLSCNVYTNCSRGANWFIIKKNKFH